MAETSEHNETAETGEEAEVDPELIALAEERDRGSALQPILFVSVIALGVWIIGDFWQDVRYFFTSSEPVDLGAATEMADGDAPDLPHNRYVHIEGIPKRRSQGKSYRYFKFVGAPIYAAVPRENPDDTLEEQLDDEPTGSVDRTYYEGKGRLVEFAEMPTRYSGVKQYYREQYRTRFCETLRDGEEQRLRERRRQLIVDNWKDRYEAASPEERREEGLTRRPSDEEIDDILEDRPICTEAYLFRAGISPGDHWWYLLIASLFGGFVLVNVWWLVRWVFDLFGTEVDVDELEAE